MAFLQYHEETDRAGYLPNMPYLSQHEPDYIKNQDLADRIDPLLQCQTSYAGGPIGTSGLQRYLQEPQNSFFTAPQQVSMHTAYYTGVYPNMGQSLHHNSQFRYGSPVSYQHSSVASGPQSPPLTDNDGHVDSTRGPSTPSDTAALSPHIVSLGSPPPNVSLYGLSGVSQGCVNPAVIQPAQTFDHTPGEEDLTGFELDIHLSFEDPTPVSTSPESNSNNALSMNTPNSLAEPRDHIETPYPEIGSMDVDIKVEDELIAENLSTVAEDDDDEYKPTRRAKSSRPSRGKSRRGRTTRPTSTVSANTAGVIKSQRSRASASRTLLSTPSGRTAMCTQCNQPFSDGIQLQKHISALHNRPFICVFHFAGCNQVFANKNEWKRHVSAQHLNLNYWLCTSGGCGHSSSASRGTPDAPTHCRVFRRKDLYTQHIRRMHAPPEVAQADKRDKTFPLDWMIKEKALQDKAFRQRCQLPQYMCCPAKGCMTVFDNGPRTWDNRMEHVAIHLDRAAKSEEPPILFGGDNDKALTDWASQPDVRVIRSNGVGWETCQPLKAARIEISKLSSLDEGLDEDAEGEEC
ncbi:hypothetical protein NW752_000484 [Fusarium irregulare]|uniref:C2H2-type domain-containing protein n=1 Tax=Fusarium irregulare TaxID=2494466 RepID=A0A9W8PYH4_9HYPO|nr:hypothetical protein NW766_001346 [Fusarium irregulare]KAJ4028227.1 hypothetical protein NW752_000484 [Fusarium irregulare]